MRESDELKVSNPKKTSQSGFLESPLTWMRTRKVRPYVRNKDVLDFGCGQHLETLRQLRPIARNVAGFDILFNNVRPQVTSDGISVYGQLEDIRNKFDVITALACFEHIEQCELPLILAELKRFVSPYGHIIGTVPRPPAKPVLEFLSYRLGIIDASQIRDHKIYYNRHELEKTALKGGWKMIHYKHFQLGMNSFFILQPV